MPLSKSGPGIGLLEKRIALLTRLEVAIGIPAGSMHPVDSPGDTPIDNSTLGYIFEYGAPERNIPAAPHLVPGVESIRDKAAEILKKAAQSALAGDEAAPDGALNKVGLLGAAAVQQKITDGPFPALAERTLQARRRKGRTGTKRLIDTGAYRRSFTYIVRRKGS